MSTEKPEVDFPGGEPPAELQITDIKPGDGAEAKAGDMVQVHYVGVAYSTGEEFDSSYDRGDPLEFQLGVGRVIAGWDQGVQGMRVGGHRQLVIPPHLAYGDRGAGNAIAPARPHLRLRPRRRLSGTACSLRPLRRGRRLLRPHVYQARRGCLRLSRAAAFNGPLCLGGQGCGVVCWGWWWRPAYGAARCAG